MKNIFRIYLPSVSIAFTVVVLATVVFNLAAGWSSSVSSAYLMAIFAIIVAVDIFDFLISTLPFKTRFSYLAITSLLEYAIVLAAMALFRWDILQPAIFLFTTLVFFGCLALVHTYFRTVHQHEADEINRLLTDHEAAK